MPSSTSSAVCSVRAALAIGATIGGWSSSWRLPLPQRFGGSATADDDHRRAGELCLRDRADAVGDARAGGQHGEARDAGQLAGRLGRERRGLLVAHVEQPHRRVGLDRAVVHREDVGAGEGEHGLDAVRPRHRDRELARRGRSARCRCRRCRRGVWVACAHATQVTDELSAVGGEVVRVGPLSASTSTAAGRTGRRAGAARGRAGGRAPAGRPRRCRAGRKGSRSPERTLGGGDADEPRHPRLEHAQRHQRCGAGCASSPAPSGRARRG